MQADDKKRVVVRKKRAEEEHHQAVAEAKRVDSLPAQSQPPMQPKEEESEEESSEEEDEPQEVAPPVTPFRAFPKPLVNEITSVRFCVGLYPRCEVLHCDVKFCGALDSSKCTVAVCAFGCLTSIGCICAFLYLRSLTHLCSCCLCISVFEKFNAFVQLLFVHLSV